MAEALRLADVHDVAPGVLHQVDAGLVGQLGEGGCEFGGHAPMLGQVHRTVARRRRCGPGRGRPASPPDEEAERADGERERHDRDEVDLGCGGGDAAIALAGPQRPNPCVETDAAPGNPSSWPAGAPFCPSKIGDPSTTRSMLM